MRRSISLRSLLVLNAAILVAVYAGIVLLIVRLVATHQAKEDVGKFLADKSYSYADKLDRDMWSRAKEIEVISRLDVFRNRQDTDALSAVIQQLHRSIPAYSWIGFLDPHGTVQVSSNGVLQGANIASRPVYHQALEGVFVGDVHDAVLLATLLPNPTGEDMKFVDISMPVYDDEQRLQGILATHLSWAWVNEMDDSFFEPSWEHEQVELFVVSRDHTVLLGRKEMLGQPLELDILLAANASAPVWQVERWPDGGVYLTGAAFGDGHLNYPGLGWTVLARQPLEVAYQHVARMEHFIIGVGVFFAVLIAGVGAATARWITRPLNTLVETAQSLRQGVVADFPPYAGIRDIEELSTALREMVASLTRTQAERDTMKVLAFVDKLTHLPNRRAFEEHLAQLQSHPPRAPHRAAVMFLDLDGFKHVNDTLGHDAGDLVLQAVAVRLKGCLRNQDTVFRLGGDEFVVVAAVDQARSAFEAQELAARIIKSVNTPLPLGDHLVAVGCSIGAAWFPDAFRTVEEVVKLADTALYRAKEQGKNRLVLHEE